MKKLKPKKQYSLQDAVIESILDKKGEDIVVIDLVEIPDTATDHLIICHADNTTQVRAIGHHVIESVKEQTGMSPFSKEGFANAEWVLIDYLNTIVHVFYKDKRTFYQLEELWSDARIQKIASL
ncbi:MAG: ribosome silencing factor [Chitinophagales bacterium]|nr:ribosome silencing factor [Chitinophagales bacterium]